MPLMMQSTVIELNISWFVMCIITHSSSKFVSLLILVVVSSTYIVMLFIICILLTLFCGTENVILRNVLCTSTK